MTVIDNTKSCRLKKVKYCKKAKLFSRVTKSYSDQLE